MSLYNNYLVVESTRVGAWLQRLRAEAEWHIIRRSHPNPRLLLEIGPGHGVMAGIASEAGIGYVAVEMNDQIARYIFTRDFHVCEATVPPLPIQSSSIDIVYASHVIEHMSNPEAALLFVQEARRVLKEKGVLFLSAPDMRSFGSDFWDADYTHCFPVTLRRLKQLLMDANLELEHSVYFSGPVQGPFSAVMSLAVKILPSELFFVSRELSERIQRLRLTFIRNICVLARKQ